MVKWHKIFGGDAPAPKPVSVQRPAGESSAGNTGEGAKKGEQKRRPGKGGPRKGGKKGTGRVNAPWIGQRKGEGRGVESAGQDREKKEGQERNERIAQFKKDGVSRRLLWGDSVLFEQSEADLVKTLESKAGFPQGFTAKIAYLSRYALPAGNKARLELPKGDEGDNKLIRDSILTYFRHPAVLEKFVLYSGAKLARLKDKLGNERPGIVIQLADVLDGATADLTPEQVYDKLDQLPFQEGEIKGLIVNKDALERSRPLTVPDGVARGTKKDPKYYESIFKEFRTEQSRAFLKEAVHNIIDCLLDDMYQNPNQYGYDAKIMSSVKHILNAAKHPGGMPELSYFRGMLWALTTYGVATITSEDDRLGSILGKQTTGKRDIAARLAPDAIQRFRAHMHTFYQVGATPPDQFYGNRAVPDSEKQYLDTLAINKEPLNLLAAMRSRKSGNPPKVFRDIEPTVPRVEKAPVKKLQVANLRSLTFDELGKELAAGAKIFADKRDTTENVLAQYKRFEGFPYFGGMNGADRENGISNIKGIEDFLRENKSSGKYTQSNIDSLRSVIPKVEAFLVALIGRDSDAEPWVSVRNDIKEKLRLAGERIKELKGEIMQKPKAPENPNSPKVQLRTIQSLLTSKRGVTFDEAGNVIEDLKKDEKPNHVTKNARRIYGELVAPITEVYQTLLNKAGWTEAAFAAEQTRVTAVAEGVKGELRKLVAGYASALNVSETGVKGEVKYSAEVEQWRSDMKNRLELFAKSLQS